RVSNTAHGTVRWKALIWSKAATATTVARGAWRAVSRELGMAWSGRRPAGPAGAMARFYRTLSFRPLSAAPAARNNATVPVQPENQNVFSRSPSRPDRRRRAERIFHRQPADRVSRPAAIAGQYRARHGRRARGGRTRCGGAGYRIAAGTAVRPGLARRRTAPQRGRPPLRPPGRQVHAQRVRRHGAGGL